MMTVAEYATDVNRTVENILMICKEMNINVTSEDDLLDDEAITILDNSLDDYEEIDSPKIKVEETFSNTQKLKKKSEVINLKKASKDNADLKKKKKDMYKNKEKLKSNTDFSNANFVLYKEGMTIKELADALGVSPAEVIKKLFSLGMVCNVNTSISYENAEILVLDYNKELRREEKADVTNFEEYEVLDDPKDLVKRPPVVTIMGHVDHGKTTLLDTIRKTSVAAGEAGGITQAISAYQVKINDDYITFIDTPGHAAFTEMRARGAKITDIVIIIVAADDGVMPQTEEAIDHAKAAGVPIIVAVNKIDKPDANPERVMTELANFGLTPEQWGGDTIFVNISALTGEGIQDLLENILLVSELKGYKANPNRYAMGTVVESRLDKHLGPVVTVLVQNGTLRLGDPLVVGTSFGKIRTLRNDLGNEITKALPSTPVEITGLNDVPSAGDRFVAFETEKEARSVAEARKTQAKQKELKSTSTLSLDDLFSKINEGLKEINVIIKTDVNGSAEAVKNSLEKLEVEGVKVKIIRSSVGAIKESDIVLAKASNAVIIGFNVRPSNEIREYAKDQGVEIRLYNIIYKVVEDMEAAMKGMLDPEYVEQILGSAEVRQLFKFSKVGTIAGSYVLDGVIKSTAKARIIRDGIVVYDGNIGSLQREKDSAKEVKKGLECGITIENFNDLKEKDIIEAYEMVIKK